MTYNFKNQNGFTLFELIVAVAIFSIVILSSTAIFQRVIEGERLAIAAQNTQESLRYTMEHISKEIRMAKEDDGTCTEYAGKIFVAESDNTVLKFKNQYDECIQYSLDGSVHSFKITRNGVGGFITPDDVYLSNLKFYVKDVDQEAITIMMSLYSLKFGGADLYKSKMEIQTTISSRYYE